MLAAVIMSIAAPSKCAELSKAPTPSKGFVSGNAEGGLLAPSKNWTTGRDIPHASVTGLTAASPSRMF